MLGLTTLPLPPPPAKRFTHIQLTRDFLFPIPFPPGHRWKRRRAQGLDARVVSCGCARYIEGRRGRASHSSYTVYSPNEKKKKKRNKSTDTTTDQSARIHFISNWNARVTHGARRCGVLFFAGASYRVFRGQREKHDDDERWIGVNIVYYCCWGNREKEMSHWWSSLHTRGARATWIH